MQNQPAETQRHGETQRQPPPLNVASAYMIKWIWMRPYSTSTWGAVVWSI